MLGDHASTEGTGSSSQSRPTARVMSATTGSATSNPLASLRAGIKAETFTSSSTEDGAASSEPSFTTFSSTSASADGSNADVQTRLRARLKECCRGAPRIRWSDEDPEAENESPVWESMGVCAVTALAKEDQKGLEEVLAEAGLWSTGSSRHTSGKCKPCHYVRSNTGCENGQSCEFCHFPHTGKSRRQLSMCSRLYCKSFRDVMVKAYGSQPDQLRSAAATASTGSAYLASVIQDSIENLPELSGAADGLEHDRPQMINAAPAEAQNRRKNIVSL